MHCVYFPPEVGGLESHVFYLCRALAAKGHRVEIVTSRSLAEAPEHEVMDGVSVWRTWFPARNPAGWALHALGSTPRFLERARDADVLHAQDIASVPPGILARARTGAPLVTTFHTSHFLKRAESPLWKPILAHFVRTSDHALAASGVTEGFLPVASPSSVIPDRRNEFYKTEDDIMHAIASAMNAEYKAIVDSGLLVQLDDARLAVTYDRMVPPGTMDDYKKWVGKQIELINYSLRGIPEDRVRYHVCWGSWNGPHTSDVPLKDIVGLLLKVRAGAYSIEAANARHEHEWQVWKNVKLPDGKKLIPGVVSHQTNVVEHPELVAERILRFAKVVGRGNVVAGTDCGFAQGPFVRRVHPSIQWAKLQSLAAGARLATKALWPRATAKRKTKPAKKTQEKRR